MPWSPPFENRERWATRPRVGVPGNSSRVEFYAVGRSTHEAVRFAKAEGWPHPPEIMKKSEIESSVGCLGLLLIVFAVFWLMAVGRRNDVKRSQATIESMEHLSHSSQDAAAFFATMKNKWDYLRLPGFDDMAPGAITVEKLQNGRFVLKVVSYIRGGYDSGDDLGKCGASESVEIISAIVTMSGNKLGDVEAIDVSMRDKDEEQSVYYDVTLPVDNALLSSPAAFPQRIEVVRDTASGKHWVRTQ